MRRFWVLLVLVTASRADIDLEKARAKVRALEADIQALIERVAPAVGAINNYVALFDPKTGKVGLQPRSMGSGCIISKDGFLLTNVHVVAGAARLTVALNDGNTYEAEVYADTSTGRTKGDIALLKLYGQERWPYVDWTKGDVKKLDPGSFVFAMGNPYGHALDGTPVVTMGVVSGIGRAGTETGYIYLGAIQSDVEINPGNSGGPLFDSSGNFIGINGLMQSRARGSNSGVGFAIPVNQVRLFLDRMMRREGTDVSYGYHGLRLASSDDGGALVQHLEAGSPAFDTLRPGDVIIKVNGKRVANRTDFINVVGQLPEHQLVRLVFRRGSNTKTGSFRLAAQPEQKGIVSKPLPLNERAYLGAEWKETPDGLVLTRVVAEAAAAKAGLAKGDLLLRFDRDEFARREATLVYCDAAGAAGVVR